MEIGYIRQRIRVALGDTPDHRLFAGYSLHSGAKGDQVEVVVAGAWSTKDTRRLEADIEASLNALTNVKISLRKIPQLYHLLAGELRPGSGIIRSSAGNPAGPSGALTCWLSSRDGTETFFLAAGHILANYWKRLSQRNCECDEREKYMIDEAERSNEEFLGKSVYRNIKGYPSADTIRSLGQVVTLSDDPNNGPTELDAGIAKMDGDFDWRQRTTCFGSFGDLPNKKELEKLLKRKPIVMKCGPEEPHWTFAKVEDPSFCAEVQQPGKAKEPLHFERQVLIRALTEKELLELKEEEPLAARGPAGQVGQDIWSSVARDLRDPRYFAVPGDSGSMVVDLKTRTPLGMLIAGSVLSGEYVMTPIDTLQDFWEEVELPVAGSERTSKGLIFLRG